MTGYFEYGIGFDDSPEVHHDSEGYWDTYTLCLDSLGVRQWSVAFGGSGWDWGAGIASSGEEILVAGSFEEHVVFNSEDGVEGISNGGWDFYLTRLNSLGSPRWVRTWGGRGWDYADDVAVGDDGTIVIVGSFEETVDFNPCPGQDWHSSNGESDTFITRLRSNGCY